MNLYRHLGGYNLPVSDSTKSVLYSVRGGGSSSLITATDNPAREHENNASAITIGRFVRSLASLGMGTLAGMASWRFSQIFPFFITPKAAKLAFVPAGFAYNAQESFFCDSAWTILTDYGLGAVMVCLATKIFRSGQFPSTLSTHDNGSQRLAAASVRKLRNLCMALSLFYAVQFSVAGVLHQFLYTLEGRNTLLFRCCWTIVVIMVSASGGAIGAIGSAVAREGLGLSRFVPGDLFWIGYTALVVAITVAGKNSCQRPAADTFFAGTSQAPSTFFLVSVVVLLGRTMGETNNHPGREVIAVQAFVKAQCVLGFLLNAALLPGYPLALYHTDITLPALNTAMHSWLCLCYILQGLSLSHIVKVFAKR